MDYQNDAEEYESVGAVEIKPDDASCSGGSEENVWMIYYYYF